MNSEFPSYSFKLEFFDERAELVRPYVLQYYTQKGEIELFDVRQRKLFLKKTTNHNLQLKDLYIGNKILINGRQYDVMDYSDDSTARAFNQAAQHTFALIKPGHSQRLGEVLDRIQQNGLVVANLRFGELSQEAAEKIDQNGGAGYLTSGPVIGLELVGPNAISKWQKIIGPENPAAAKTQAPNSLRALYGKSITENFVHGSDSPEASARELGIVFGGRAIQLVCNNENSTLCLIKPHAIKEGLAGQIIQKIVESGYRIGGAMMAILEINTANEFMEVYRGVVAEYQDMITEMSSGAVIALELVKQNAISDFRQLCGPRDVSVARQIRPQSLRAMFGSDIVHNAVHCSDLDEDAPLEVEYFFILLDQ